jgi:hypothetical protein
VVTDAPVQVYAILFVPARAERGLFSLRKEDGLKLYSRKVLIREYTKDLFPEYFRFVQGVVDSEDLPLNVSREAVQSSAVMARLKKILTGQFLNALKDQARSSLKPTNASGRSLAGSSKKASPLTTPSVRSSIPCCASAPPNTPISGALSTNMWGFDTRAKGNLLPAR